MRKLTIIILIFCTLASKANHYYVASSGNNSASGLIGFPWLTISKVNSTTFAAGDIISFNGGDIFTGNLIIAQSGSIGNPITVNSYGTGKAVITGFVTVNSWSLVSTGIYKVATGSLLTTCNMVLRGGVVQQLGRYPNANAVNSGYLTFQTHVGQTSITSNAISTAPSFVGGEVVIRPIQHILDRCLITAQTSTTVSYTSVSSYTPIDGYGFFFQNHLSTLDQLGEWYYDPATKDLYMYWGATTPTAVEVSAIDINATATSKSYITFQNISFRGANSTILKLDGSNHVTVDNCDLLFAGRDAITGLTTTTSTISNNLINYANSNSIYFNLPTQDIASGKTTTSNKFSDNTITNTSLFAGMGRSGDVKGMAIAAYGGSDTVLRNTITKTGYCPIYFVWGDNILIKNNIIDSFCITKNDGSAIYTYNNGASPLTFTGQRVTGNICINSVGAPNGTNSTALAAYGIYFDINASGCEVDSNTCYNVDRGLFNLGGWNLNIHHNTFYANATDGIDIYYGSLAWPHAVDQLTIKNNIFFARATTELSVKYRTVLSALAFGTIDSNYICRPIFEPSGINSTLSTAGGDIYAQNSAGTKYYSLDIWKTIAPLYDVHSNKTFTTVSTVGAIRFEYNATATPTTVDLGSISYIVATTGVSKTGVITLQPYTSIILIPAPTTCPTSGITTTNKYYFSPTCGNDLRTPTQARNPATPWQTLSKVSSYFPTLVAGDTIALNKGETFTGTIAVNKSGTALAPIVITSYGSGAKPIISGLTNLTTWASVGGNVWECSQVQTVNSINLLLINGSPIAMGRYPNSDAANGGYLTITSHVGQTSITCSTLGAAPNWSGAELVMRVRRWCTDRDLIGIHSGSIINYTASSIYSPDDGMGFFIQNAVATLDQQNEWYYNSSTKKMRMYSTVNPSTLNVQIGTTRTLLTTSTNKNYITVDGIDFTGANDTAISILGGNNFTVKNCNIYNIGTVGISTNGTFTTAQNDTTSNCQSNGIYGTGSSLDMTVSNNYVYNTMVFPGMGQSADFQGEGIQVHGSRALVQLNKVINSGYVGIYFDHKNDIIIRKNIIDYFGLVKDDGGGLYTYTGSSTTATGQVIENNIISNGIGAPAGTNAQSIRKSPGIYLDINTSNGLYQNNSCYNNSPEGLFLNAGCSNNTIRNNTFYNNTINQFHINSRPSDSSKGNIIKNNIFFAVGATQQAARYETAVSPSDINQFGTIDSNYYLRPINDNLTIVQDVVSTVTNMSLAMWKTAHPTFDVHSQKSPVAITNVNQLQYVVNATASTVIATLLAGNWVSVANVPYNTGFATLTAFTSLPLINTGTTNTPPTANAGIDQTIQLPVSSVTLSGSGTDVGGSIASYAWTKVSGGAATITSPSSASTTVTGLVAGVYQFKLTVTDNGGLTASDNVQITVNAANAPPTANAGTDQAITLPTSSTTLSGSGSDPDGSITGYAWTRISGPNTPTIVTPTAASTSVTGLIAGTYVFRLTVTDNQSLTGFDDMQVIVSNSPNVAPTANAGIDQTIQLPTNSVSLTGSGSDPDGTIAAYLWTQVSGGTASITSPTTAATAVTGMVAGTYQFKLTVTDNGGLTGSDIVVITVLAANIPPTVNAGTDQTIVSPTSVVTLSGSATDIDGTIVSHTWTKTSGTGGTITNPSLYTTTVTGLAVGTYVFRLTAIDNNGGTGFDEMNVAVNVAPNVPPTANAGVDQTITIPANSVNLLGTGTDTDGTIVVYSWTKVLGGAATITSPSTAATAITGLNSGVYQFRFMVTDNVGATAADTLQVTVNKGAATLSYFVPSLTRTYDGLPVPVIVNSTPSGLGIISTTYDNVGAIPIDAGFYTVRSGLTNIDWTAATITDIFRINKRTLTITLSNLTQTFDNTQKFISYSISAPGQTDTTVVIAYTGGHTAVGTYPVSATLINKNDTAFASGTLTIVPASTATIHIDTLSLNKVYDGSQKSVSVSTNPASQPNTVTYLGISGTTYPVSNIPPQNGGNYKVIAVLNSDASIKDSAIMIVAKANATLVWPKPGNIKTGTPLSGAQLNANASFGGVPLAGSFSYSPGLNSILPKGTSQLNAIFTATAANNFNTGTISTTISVTGAPITGFYIINGSIIYINTQ